MKQSFHATLIGEKDAVLRMQEGGKNRNNAEKEGKQYKLVCCHTEAHLFKKTLLANVEHLLSGHMDSPPRTVQCRRRIEAFICKPISIICFIGKSLPYRALNFPYLPDVALLGNPWLGKSGWGCTLDLLLFPHSWRREESVAKPSPHP